MGIQFLIWSSEVLFIWFDCNYWKILEEGILCLFQQLIKNNRQISLSQKWISEIKKNKTKSVTNLTAQLQVTWYHRRMKKDSTGFWSDMENIEEKQERKSVSYTFCLDQSSSAEDEWFSHWLRYRSKEKTESRRENKLSPYVSAVRIVWQIN